MTLAKLVAVFPIELLLNAIVTRQDLPFIATFAALTITTTILVIWVVEPSAMRTHQRFGEAAGGHARHQAELRLPTPWTGLFVVSPPDEPFTPADFARASRRAEIAEIANRSGLREAAFQPGTGPRPSHR